MINMKYIIYLRVSTDDQDVQAQRAACLEYIKRNGGGEHLEFCDQAVSGTLRMEEREQMMNAINALTKGDIFLVARRDRLGRDVIHNAIIEAEIKKKKCKLVTVTQDDSNMDAGMAQMMRTLVDAFAQYERYLISQRTKARLQEKKKVGQRVGRVPYGYRLLPDGIHIAPCPKEQATLAMLHEWQQAGLSYRDIEKMAEENGLLNREGKKWLHRNIYGVLHNRVLDYKCTVQAPTAEESGLSLQRV
jgi:DNA invertase Pin-like site-specific DNA recombinase